MTISVILAHPERMSFNHAIAMNAITTLKKNGHEVNYHDLYSEKFDPILPPGEIPRNISLPTEIEKHCEEIREADGIIIIHPNWWGQPPAILKGWIDRVIRPGIAYKFLEDDDGEGIPVGLLKAKSAIVFNTSNTPPEREQNVFGDPLQLIWKNCIFDLCGVKNFHREMFTVVVTSTQKQRVDWLNKVETVICKYFPPDNLNILNPATEIQKNDTD